MFVGRYCSIGVVILLNLNVLCHGQHAAPPKNAASMGLAFQEDPEKNEDKQNSQGKSPVYVKDFCKEGEILYPGDQGDDWVCDCRPGHLYHPDSEKCYQAHSQGPCAPGQYLVLPPNHVVPVCQRNPCGEKDYVQHTNGNCYKLDTPGPCLWGTELSNVIGVDETTLEIICTGDARLKKINPTLAPFANVGNETSIVTRFFDDDIVMPEDSTAIKHVNGTQVEKPCTLYRKHRCFIGGIRWTQIRCPEQIASNEIKTSHKGSSL